MRRVARPTALQCDLAIARGVRRRGRPFTWFQPFLESLEARETPTANLSIAPISWNVIGLDSNNVSVGPNSFPVGVRVTNTGTTAAANVHADFTWDSANPLINLSGQATQTLSALAPGGSADLYYAVDVTRSAAAYTTARRFHVSAAADGVSAVSTPLKVVA